MVNIEILKLKDQKTGNIMNRWLKTSFAAIILLMLSGCSTQFYYNNLDWLFPWYLDDFVSLDDNQDMAIEQAFERVHRWHRTNELPVYVAFLDRTIELVEQPSLDIEQVSAFFVEPRQFWQNLIGKSAPEIAAIAKTLSDQQIEALFEQLEQKNQDYQEDILEFREGLDQQALLKKRTKRNNKNTRKWIGKLSKAQQAIVLEATKQATPTAEVFLEYRRLWQSQMKSLMLEQRQSEGFEQAFVDLMFNPYQSEVGQQLNQMRNANAQVFAQMYVALHPTLNNKQTTKILKKLRNFRDDFSELSQQ